MMTRRVLEDEIGNKVTGETIKSVRYADDTAIVASSEEDLQKVVSTLIIISEYMLYKFGESAHPCLTPFYTLKNSVFSPLILTAASCSQYSDFIKFISPLSAPIFCNIPSSFT